MYFVPIMLGLIFGEILCQSESHMSHKWSDSFSGYLICLEHSVLYTAAMVFFLYLFCAVNPINVVMILSILIGHYIVEKVPFTHWWLTYMRCEPYPLQAYYQQRLGADAVGTEEWSNYINSNPVLDLNGEHLGAYIYYLSEYTITSRALQFVITFFTVVVLDRLKYI